MGKKKFLKCVSLDEEKKKKWRDLDIFNLKFSLQNEKKIKKIKRRQHLGKEMIKKKEKGKRPGKEKTEKEKKGRGNVSLPRKAKQSKAKGKKKKKKKGRIAYMQLHMGIFVH